MEKGGSKRTAPFLAFFDKPLLAAGAGNRHLALAPGNPDGLAALRAGEIPVLPVFQPFHQHQILPVFLIPLIGIAGKSTEKGPNHQAVRNHRKEQTDRSFDKDTHQAYDQTGSQNHCIELIRSVTADHKPPQFGAHIRPELPEPISKTIHSQSPFALRIYLHYIANY